jgi:hypothetical protein
VIPHVSYSQIKTFACCPRKWWVSKVACVPVPSTPATDLGSAVHTAIEKYLVAGTLFPDDKVGRIAASGAFLLPPPGSCHRDDVERPIIVPVGKIPFKGVVDLLTPGAVIDHKTTSAPQYADTPDMLRSDWQMLSYAAWAFSVLDVPELEIRKNYFLTRGVRAWAVSATVTRADVDAVVPEIERTIDRMVACSTVPEHEVPQNFDHCGAYGGCPFRARCFGSKPFGGLFAVDAARNAPKGTIPMNAPPFNRDAFAQSIAMSPYAALTDEQVAAMVAGFPPLAASLGLSRTQQMVNLEVYFGGSSALRDSWIQHALVTFVKRPVASINPPEQDLAVSSVETLAGIQTAAKKTRDVAKTSSEKDLRSIIRTTPIHEVKRIVMADDTPSVTPAYDTLRGELRAGVKRNMAEVTNPIASEYDARGWSVTTVGALLAGPPVVLAPVDAAFEHAVMTDAFEAVATLACIDEQAVKAEQEVAPAPVSDMAAKIEASYTAVAEATAALVLSAIPRRPRVLLIDACVVSGEQATPAHVVFADVIREVAEHLNVPHYAFPDFRKGERTLAAQLARRGWPEGVHTIALDSRGNVYPTLFEHLVPLADVVIRGYGS